MTALSSQCDVTEMLHSWWMAECHLDRLQSQHRLKAQDLEKHRDIALEYITYFESTLLPSKTSDAPRGTRLERIEELWGYRHGCLQNYDRLKAWLQEGEHKLKFIKAHLACTLAALQGGQVKTPDGTPNELHGREAEMHKALHDLLQQHHKSLLEWKDSHKTGSSAVSASKDVRSARKTKLADTEVNSKAGDSATLPPPDSADAQDLKQAGLFKTELTDATTLQHWVDYKQERVRSLEARLEQAEYSREYHRQEKQKLQACMQAGKKASKLHEEVREEGEQREEELKQENDKIVSELKAAEQATRQAEQRIVRQALEIELTHATIAKLEQVNGNLQTQVNMLSGENGRFAKRVNSLQKTTNSLSTQVAALARRAEAESAGNKIEVLKSVAACLQRERDAVRSDLLKADQENQTLSSKVADLTCKLSDASSRIESLPNDGGSPKQGGNSSKNGGKSGEEFVSKEAPEVAAQNVPLTPSQAAAYEATIKQLLEKLQAGETKCFKLEQDKKHLHKELKVAMKIEQDVKGMQADLIKSAEYLDSLEPPPVPSQAAPAPQISPASPPNT